MTTLLQHPSFKLPLLGLLWLLLLLPLAMIGDLGQDRAAEARVAREQVAAGWGGAQLLSGVFLGAEYKDPEFPARDAGFVLLPDAVTATARLTVDERKVGIFPVPVYRVDVDFRGHFRAADLREWFADRRIIREATTLRFAFADPRGARSIGRLEIGGRAVDFAPGDRSLAALAELRAPWPEDLGIDEDLPFAFSLSLNGLDRLQILAFARDLTVEFSGDWPHPSFLGGLLPSERAVTASGFTAAWRVNAFQRGFPQTFTSRELELARFEASSVGVRLFQPDSPYVRIERTTKYGALFLAVLLASFLLAERLFRLRLLLLHHALIGAALVLFTLLLLAIAEVLGFAIAYAVATLVVAVLVGAYCAAVLHAMRRGVLVASWLCATYGVLYVLVCAEEHALLMGSVLLTGLLAGVMLLTRHQRAALLAESSP